MSLELRASFVPSAVAMVAELGTETRMAHFRIICRVITAEILVTLATPTGWKNWIDKK